MVQIILLRPGKTDYDLQTRIQGVLDIPLSDAGREDAAQIAEKLQVYIPKAIYCGPSRAASETAGIIAQRLELKPKTIDRLQNVNLGLWQGLLVEEVRVKQPKVYKQWQEHPETIQPPDGEMLADAAERAMEAVDKLARKHRSGSIALVIPEPLASLVQHRIQGTAWCDLWQTSNGCSRIESMVYDKDAIKAKAAETLNAKSTAVNGKSAPVNGKATPVNGKSTKESSSDKAVVATENRVDGPAAPAPTSIRPTLVYRGATVKQ